MTHSAQVYYAREPTLPVTEFRRVLSESGLGQSRPIENEPRLAAMLSASGLILTARLNGQAGPVVGVARCLSDFTWCCYMSELAVCPAARGLGIGKGLLTEARRQLGPGVSIVLISVAEAVSFYEQSGMERTPDAFWFPRAW